MDEKGIPKPPENIYLVGEDRKATLEYWRWLQRIYNVFPKVQTFDAVINGTSVSAQTTSEQNFNVSTVANVTVNDRITVNKPTHTAGLGIANARVVAAGTVGITYFNVTTAAIDPPSETYRFEVIRK